MLFVEEVFHCTSPDPALSVKLILQKYRINGKSGNYHDNDKQAMSCINGCVQRCSESNNTTVNYDIIVPQNKNLTGGKPPVPR